MEVPQTRNRAERIPGGIAFTKMSGSGNDFVVIDHRQPVLAADDIAGFTRAVCRRRLSVGADGVILIEQPVQPGTHFRWRYINADGSDGDMCGNGAMCAARFAVDQGIAPASCRFETAAGLIEAEVAAGAGQRPVTLRLAPVPAPGPVAPISVMGETWPGTFVRIGVPHVVVVTNDVDAWNDRRFDEWGRAVRYHPAFAPAGTNANLVHRVDTHTIRMRTWERGVEGETLACGTGAVASAIVAVRHVLVSPPVRVVVSSGAVLSVDFQPGEETVTGIRLAGEPRVVACGTISAEALV